MLVVLVLVLVQQALPWRPAAPGGLRLLP
jgi:hypothetical protein